MTSTNTLNPRRAASILTAVALMLGLSVMASPAASAAPQPYPVRLAYDPGGSFLLISGYSPNGKFAVGSDGAVPNIQISVAAGTTKPITIPNPVAIDSGLFLYGRDSSVNTLHRQDMTTGTSANFPATFTKGIAPGGWKFESVVSGDASGRYVLLNATNGTLARAKTFLYDLSSNQFVSPHADTDSYSSAEQSFGRAISADGNLITYSESDAGLIDRVIEWNRTTGARRPVARPVEVGNGVSGGWDVSDDLKWVVFQSSQAGVLPGLDATTRLYQRRAETGVTQAVPVDWRDTNGSVRVDSYATHNGGRVVVTANETSSAGGIGPQLFVWEPGWTSAVQVSVGPTGVPSDHPIHQLTETNSDASSIVFSSFATNLTPGANTSDRRIYEATLPGFSLQSLSPARLLESRVGPELKTIDGLSQGTGRTTAGGVTELKVTGRGGVATDASAVFLNVVAVSPAAGGYLTVFPCGTTPPLAANVNHDTGGIAANAVLAKIGTDGKVCIFSFAATDLVIDVNGFVAS